MDSSAACRLYPRGRPLRPPTAAQTLQEDLQEDGQDPGTSVCAVILSTNQLTTFLWRMDEFFNGVEAYIHPPKQLTVNCCQ